MSRQVDISEGYESLSQDDLAYLAARNRLPASAKHLLDTTVQSRVDKLDDRIDALQDEAEDIEDELESISIAAMSKSQLKEILDENGVTYSGKANKEALQELVEELDLED